MSQEDSVKKVILLGRKLGAGRALTWLVEHGVEVPFVVASPSDRSEGSLSAVALSLGVEVLFDSREVYARIDAHAPSVQNIDLVVSFLCPERIREPLIALGKRGCVNFHPAPLPDYKSRAGYNTAILDGRDSFGVSAHFIDSEKFDAGPIIKVLNFPIDSEHETVLSLEPRTQEKLFELFEEVMSLFLSGEKIHTLPNEGGLYLTATQLEKMKEVDLSKADSDIVDRMIRAFFFPPYSGAYVTIEGKKYTLVNEEMLGLLATLLGKKEK